MRIAVVGAGAMGQLFGTKLLSGGHEVTMVDSSPTQVSALQANGMILVEDGVRTRVRADARLAADLNGTFDAVVLLTKTLHSAAALASVAHVLTDHTVGISVQNGLGNEEPLLDHFGVDRTVIGMTDYPADRGSDGAVRTDANGRVTLGGLVPVAEDHARRWAALCDAAGLRTRFAADVMVSIWEKVLFNAALNTISAATGNTIGAISAHPRGRALVAAVLAEAIAVAEAAGVRVDAPRVRSAVEMAFAEHGEHRTSMLVDLERGRETEIESIGGAIVEQAREHAVPAPVLATLCDVVRLRTRAQSLR